MCPFKTNRDMRKLKWQYKVRNMPKKSLPAIIDRAVWENISKGRIGIGWDSVVEKVWKDIRESPEERMSAEKFGRYKADIESRIKRKARAKKQAEPGRNT